MVIARWTTIALITKESSGQGIINGERKSNRVKKTIRNRKIQSRTIVSQTIDLDDCFFFFLPQELLTQPWLPKLPIFLAKKLANSLDFVVCRFKLRLKRKNDIASSGPFLCWQNYTTHCLRASEFHFIRYTQIVRTGKVDLINCDHFFFF